MLIKIENKSTTVAELEKRRREKKRKLPTAREKRINLLEIARTREIKIELCDLKITAVA
jgi:hypothetical protein